MLYIANSHFSERRIREIQVLQDDIKELRWEYMTLAAENRVKAQRSQMADRFAILGLKPFERSLSMAVFRVMLSIQVYNLPLL